MDTNTRKTLFSSASDEWATPPELLALASEVMEGIALDPCDSKDHPNPFARHSFNIDTTPNSLERIWHYSNIWMNPPFSNINTWTEKLALEYARGNCTEAIALLPARTDTKWFVNLAKHAEAFCFLRGRVLYIPPRGPNEVQPELEAARARVQEGDLTGEMLKDAQIRVEELERELKTAKTKAPFPSVAIYLGWRSQRFMDVFEPLGLTLQTRPRF